MSAADSRPAARLVLEDGTVFTGRAFGACRMPLTSAGELVFNTAMTGYQEALTDPSYAGQILTMTAPLIGNYGVGPEDVESGRPQVSGFVVRELARRHSNFRADRSVDEWLLEAGVLGIERIDTRALVRTVRIHGAMRSVLTCDPDPRDDDLVDTARAAAGMAGRNLAREVSPDAAFEWQDDLGPWTGPGTPAPGERPLDVIALDCGAKRNIYRHLVSRGCRVRALPHDVSAEEILAAGADGLLVSNGPGDPAAVESTVRTLRAVIGKLPIMGICLGHQLLALALGAGTYKLKFGHRGGNQPVRNLLTGNVEITSQNHGFCVDGERLERLGCETTHLHLNDGTLAGFRHRELPLFSVQFHPEASPGPHDSAYLFDCFVAMIRDGGPITAEQMVEAQAEARRWQVEPASG